MAGFTPTEKNVIVDAERARLAYASLHTADPGTTGTSEATGGGYARKAVSWGAAAAGVSTGAEITFDAAAGSYGFVGYWSAVSGGTFLGSQPTNPTPITLGAAGQIKHTPTLSLP